MLRESLNRTILGCWEDKLEEQSYSENTATHKSLSNTKLIVTSDKTEIQYFINRFIFIMIKVIV